MEPFIYRDLGYVDYQEALYIQTEAFETSLQAKMAGKRVNNQLLFCEHNPVLTMGKHGKKENLLISENELAAMGVDFYQIDRGGDITYHGPGQITGYPIFDLETWGIGLREYIFALEEIVMHFLESYGLNPQRMKGATGVWLDPDNKWKARKICAIGVRSSRFVTMHGFALNINTDLKYYDLIHPCGFVDKGVTSLERELGEKQDMEIAKQQLLELFQFFFAI